MSAPTPRRPLCIDLFCGLGGWSEGFLSEGYDVIGFDIERHDYGTGGYPGQLVLQDVLTLDGAQFKNAAVIVASPPCQAYSYMAMPWTRAKALAAWYRDAEAATERIAELTALFDACFRIAREANVPLVVENVKGAQPWVGTAKAHYGSFYLWGDVASVGGAVIGHRPKFGETLRARGRAMKANPDGTGHGQSAAVEGMKGFATGLGRGHDWRQDPSGRFNSKSTARKAASAQIAKIPFPLASHIARIYKPRERATA